MLYGTVDIYIVRSETSSFATLLMPEGKVLPPHVDSVMEK